MTPPDNTRNGTDDADGIDITPVSELTEEQKRNRLDLITHLGQSVTNEQPDEEFLHPVIALKQRAEEAREHRDKWEGKEVLACDVCGTQTPKEDMKEAVKAAEKHDNMRHDGEPTATVNGITPPTLSDEQKEQIQTTMDKLEELDDIDL